MRRRRRRRAVRGLAALVLLAAAGLAAAGAWRLLRPGPPPPAPAFDLPEAGGGRLSLEQLRGRPVVLVFFRTFFSPPARRQLADLEQLYPRLRAAGAEVVAVTVASRDQVRAGKEELGLSFPVLADEGHAAAEAYGVYDRLGDGLAGPAVFLLDGEGRIRWRFIGEHLAARPWGAQILKRVHGLAGAGG